MENLKAIFCTVLQIIISFHVAHTSTFGFAFEHF